MSKDVTEKVFQEVSSCKCNRCSNIGNCAVLGDYIKKVGMDEFKKQLENKTLPEEIQAIYSDKAAEFL